MKQQLFVASLGVLCFVGLSKTSSAGNTSSGQSAVTIGSGYAYGSMGYVYSEANAEDLSEIGCSVEATGGTLTATCHACPSAGCGGGNEVSCTSTDAIFIATLSSITSDATLLFYWNGSNICDGMDLYDYSTDVPK